MKALGIGIGFEISRLSFMLNSTSMPKSGPVVDTTLKVDGMEEKDWIFEEHLLANHCIAVAYKRLNVECVSSKEKVSNFKPHKVNNLVLRIPSSLLRVSQYQMILLY